MLFWPLCYQRLFPTLICIWKTARCFSEGSNKNLKSFFFSRSCFQMINHFLILRSTIPTSRRNQRTKAMEITSARSGLLKQSSRNHSRSDPTSRAMISSRETRPPLSRKISHTRNELSFQLVSLTNSNCQILSKSSRHFTTHPRDRVSLWDQLKHSSARVTLYLLADWVS